MALRTRSRTAASFVLCVLVGVALLMLVQGSLGAQARLLESSPADGASVRDLEVVTFEFDTLLRPDDAAVTVLRRDGTEVTVTAVTVDRSVLTARLSGGLPSGNYEVSYAVEGSDGRLNEGSIRVSVASPAQELSGGLLAVLAIAAGMCVLLAVVFWRDKKRRPAR